MAEAIAELTGNSFYHGKTKILDGISWTIHPHEHWALIGPNGSGKTTLLKILSGNLWPSSGTVKILGKKFGKADLRELRKHIGWVSSYLTENIPREDSIVDIVVSGKHASFGVYEAITSSDRKRALGLIEFMGCGYLLDRWFPVLSQGEQQKILIARALMGEPALLVLDEPCTGLDMKARKSLLGSVSKICRRNKSTVVYVTHHIEEIIDEFRHVLMIRSGKVFFKGAKEKALTGGRIKELFK